MSKEIILEKCFEKSTDKYLGMIVIAKEDLAKKMKEIHPKDMPTDERTFIQAIKEDEEDKMGYKKYHKKLRKEGFDV